MQLQLKVELHSKLSIASFCFFFVSQLTRNTSKDTEVFITDLENRARELNIFDLTPFFNSVLFKNFGMKVDRAKGIIVKTYM